VIPKTSIPPLRAIRNGMKPAVDQSLSRIAYLFSVDVQFVVVTFRLGIYDAEIEPTKEAILMIRENFILTSYTTSRRQYIKPQHRADFLASYTFQHTFLRTWEENLAIAITYHSVSLHLKILRN